MNDNQLDMTFNALADPTRRAILARLAQGVASVGELAAPFEVSRGHHFSSSTHVTHWYSTVFL